MQHCWVFCLVPLQHFATEREEAACWWLPPLLGFPLPAFCWQCSFWVINIWLYHALGLKKHSSLPQARLGCQDHFTCTGSGCLPNGTGDAGDLHHSDGYPAAGIYPGCPGTWHSWKIGDSSRHAFRNALIPILTTLGTSLRFSLASLPIIEGFFNWRGLGWNLLKAIQSNQAVFVTDLILALGLFFLVINLVLELLYRRIDPRLCRGSRQVEDWEEAGLSSEWGSFLEEIKIVWQDLKVTLKIYWLSWQVNQSRFPGDAHPPSLYSFDASKETPQVNHPSDAQPGRVSETFRYWQGSCLCWD